MAQNRLIFIFVVLWTSICGLSCFTVGAANAADADIDCPSPGEAFVTTCSGSESSHPDRESPASAETNSFEDSDLVDEVLEESSGNYSHSNKARNSGASTANNGDAEEDASVVHQMKLTTKKLIQQYYEPLPRPGKCAIGTICGFTASRLTLGVANRLVRAAGATWVLSEMMHTFGFCDDAICLPEEARPWIVILRKALIKQCVKVRTIARKIWNQDRIREIAQKDEMAAGGFAVGAFIGFVV